MLLFVVNNIIDVVVNNIITAVVNNIIVVVVNNIIIELNMRKLKNTYDCSEVVL